MDVLTAETILWPVLHETFGSVDHEDALTVDCVLLIQDENASRDSSSIEQVRRQPDDSLDEALLQQSLTNGSLCVPAKQHAMREDHRRLASALQ